MELKFETDYKNGDFVVRTQKIGKLPKGLKKTPKLQYLIDILLIQENEVCAFDYEELLEMCGRTDSELKHELGNWILKNKLNDSKWTPIKIHMFRDVPKEATLREGGYHA